MRSFLCAALAVAVAAPASLVLTTPASAAKWWRCDNGYNLEGPNNAAVRCVRPEVSREVPLVPCPPGTTVVTRAGHDQCRFPINNTLTDRVCTPPLEYISKPGLDACKLITQPADSKPPSVEVQR